MATRPTWRLAVRGESYGELWYWSYSQVSMKAHQIDSLRVPMSASLSHQLFILLLLTRPRDRDHNYITYLLLEPNSKPPAHSPSSAEVDGYLKTKSIKLLGFVPEWDFSRID
jgi:hypothetical protein